MPKRQRSTNSVRDLFTQHLVINEDSMYDPISYKSNPIPPGTLKSLPVGDIGPTPLPEQPINLVKRSPRRWLVGPIAFLYMAGYTIGLFTFSQYVYNYLKVVHLHGVDLNNSFSICILNESSELFKDQMKVQEISSNWNIYYTLAGGVIAVVSNLVLGSYTDKFGRKFLFFLPCIGTLIRTCISAAGIRLTWDLSYHLIGYIIEGFTGQMFTLLLVSYTYVADITSTGKQRSLGLAMIELMIGLGVTVMSFVSGYYIEKHGFWDPMVASMIFIVAAILLICLLPEPYSKEHRQQAETKFENLKTAGRLYCSSSNAGNRWRYVILLIVFMTSAMVALGRVTVEGLYQLDYPFCWTPEKLGWFGALKSGIQQVLSMGMVVVLQFCFSDEIISVLGCASFAAGFLLEAFAETDVMMYAVTVAGGIGLLTLPMVRAIMSRMTSMHLQGAVFASISAAETFCNLVSAILSSAIYSATLDIFRGSVFIFFAGLNIIGTILMLIFYALSRPKPKYELINSS